MFWFDTEFGKALAKIVPNQCTRVVIDIPVDDVVTIHYTTVAAEKIVNMPWQDVLKHCAVREVKVTDE